MQYAGAKINNMKIAVCLIATHKYNIFVQPLIDSIKKYFLLNHQIEVHLFVDELADYQGDDRVMVNQTLIVSYRFPYATLYRYKIMTGKEYDCDYIYYFDVDYLLVDTIDEEIFGDVVAVLHPGFSVVGGGSWCTDKNSNAYTYPENRKQYFCGGTQGGRYEHFYRIMKRLSREIDDDEKRGVKAEWNDEGHWNRLLSELNNFKILDSRYCMVEQQHLRERWKIDHLKPKILALEKNHKEFQS